jgi:hypothetical protein
MMNKAFFLFIILLLGLVLSSFLGSFLEGFTTTTYDGPNAQGATVTGANGNSAGVVLGPQGNVYTGSNVNGTVNTNQYDNYNHYSGANYPSVYYGPNGGKAQVFNSNGSYTIIVTDNTGTTYTYSPSTSSSSSSSSSSAVNISTLTFTSQNGDTAKIYYSNGQYVIETTSTNSSGQQTTTIYNSNNTSSSTSSSSTDYNNVSAGQVTGPAGNSAGYVTGPAGNSAGYVSGPYGNTAVGTSSNPYASVYPQGIPASMIPPGQEDLYILKSEIVPPVCPACPSSSACPRTEKPPPCPACARCPEPSFECKKVPNYNAIGENYLPVPVLNNFSTFGM